MDYKKLYFNELYENILLKKKIKKLEEQINGSSNRIS